MVMEEFVKSFPDNISDAINIIKKVDINIDSSKIKNIVILGQGGSAMGGVIVRNLLNDKISIPILVNQNYQIPAFVNEHTLIIASSYSGNTEETLFSLNEAYQRKSKIFCICSGGDMLHFAKNKSIKYVNIPSGGAPRAMLCFSIIYMLFIISRILDIYNNLELDLLDVKKYLNHNQNDIIKVAKDSAKLISNKMPFIYAFPEFEGVALRFKQQLNENTKRHACYNLIPEMNHNEIVPWVNKTTCVVPIFLNGSTFKRNKQRMDISIETIKSNVDNLIELKCDNKNTYLQQYFYFIHLVDWISIIIAKNDFIDPNDIKLINYLKDELRKNI